jgi:glycosyltransferase involved in cell wall biosynthesis
MNLLFYCPHLAAYGGIERHLCALAAAAAGRGHAVTLLTTGNSLGAELRTGLALAGVVLLELPVPRRHAGKTRKLLWLLSQVALLRATRWDAIYTNGQGALARVVWWAGRGARVRRVHHHHTSADATERARWTPAYLRVVRDAPELVGCSRATCAGLAAETGRMDARFLPYLTRCPVSASAVVERAPGPRLRFGFVGRLIPEKGIDALCRLSADPALADLAWHVHGDGPAFPGGFFQAWPNVRHHGAYEGVEAQARALLDLDALVLFSTHNEGMPLSLIEGMSAGLPWIATDRGGTRELALSPADAVVVPHPASDETLRDGVLSLAGRIRAGETSRLAQRRVYDAHFAPETVARRWLDFLESSADSRPAATP